MSIVGELTHKGGFLRNFSLLTVGNFGSRAIAMVVNILAARYLASERYGEYSLVMTYISLLYFVASLGLSQVVIRSVARHQDNSGHYLRMSMCLRLLGFVISAAVFGIYGFFSDLPFGTVAIFVILGGVFMESLWEGLQNVAFGMQRMEWNTIISLASSFLTLLAYIVLPRELYTVESLLLIYLGIYLLKNIAYYLCLRRDSLILYSAEDTDYDIRTMMRESLPFYLMMLLGIFTSQAPVIFLNANAGLKEVAYFNTANKLLLPLSLFLNSAFSAYFPNQSILFASDRQAFSRQTRNVLALACLAGVLFAFTATLFKVEIVGLLYGSEYSDTASVLAYQCWYTVLYGIFCLNGNTLGAADAQKKLAICSVIYAIVSTPILWFSSKYGARGLAIGFVCASIINLMYIFPVLRRTVGGELNIRFSLILIGGILLSMAFSIAVSEYSTPLVRVCVFLAVSAALFLCRKRITALVGK